MTAVMSLLKSLCVFFIICHDYFNSLKMSNVLGKFPQASVIQQLNSAIHQINHYLGDKS